MKSDLQRAYEALTNKRDITGMSYDLLWRYYDGLHPLRYSSERLREVFSQDGVSFAQNWASVVVDSTTDRIQMRSMTAGRDRSTSERLQALLEETELLLDAEDVHRAALVCGEGYVIAWREEGGPIEAYYHDPRSAHVFYDPASPRRKRFAAKWWIDEADEHRYLTLYYPDRLEYYRSASKASEITSWKAFEPLPEYEGGWPVNPFGIVPVFRWARERRAVTSELANMLRPQDAVNKLISDMMVASEFGAFRQRWVISNADVSALKNNPYEFWDIPAAADGEQGAQVGEFSATELRNYLDAVDHQANVIAVLTRTPKHLLFGQGGTPSGEALIAMEAPLNKKCEAYINRWQPEWRALGAFLLKLDGVEVEANELAVVFEPPATVQPRTEAEVRQMSVQAGLPLVTVLRREGWSDEEIAAMQQDADEAAVQQTNQLAAALVEAERRASQNGNGDDNLQPAGTPIQEAA